MSFYAVWVISNENHQNYGQVGGFIVEEAYDGDLEGSPMYRESEEEMIDELKDHALYKAGLVEIIEI